MRRLALVLGAVALTSCAKPDTPPAEAPAAPAINLADLAGNWTVTTRAEGTDSVLVTGSITATADPAGWTISLPGRPTMPMRVTVDGDSIMTATGPYESVLRPGVQVSTAGVLRLVDGKLTGVNVAHYVTSGADSVVRLTTEATRAQ